MYSPSRRTPISPRNAARLHGLFKENEWYCNCPTRERAVRFQVKKEGPNRGRWFMSTYLVYTCQKSQHQRCGFFLWQEDANPREKEILMANSHSEIDPRTQTPSKTLNERSSGLLTPQTECRILDISPNKYTQKPPSTPLSAKARMMAEDTDDFSWDLDTEDESEITAVLSSSQRADESFISQPNFHAVATSPNKVPRTPKTISPGKRKRLEDVEGSSFTSSSSLFPTPSSSHSASFSSRIPPSSAELCMTPTPTKYRDVLSSESRSNESSFARDIMAILEKHEVVIPNAARDELVARANLEDSKCKGAMRARDMLRGTMKKKDQEMQLLKEKNTNLRAQSEMDQQMINSFSR
ncbi:uncharacterized protein N7483_008293 [Penicillium malachiteum]|uniref:uncharacterized protein n=1 Tax=Penicillium malachiteum TaxID=1324776 RepID=UPI0025473411|nr:uncharacterized protein N7483_008293 [Penicillium malachiteum]KAJ5720359.1 hypothetical protein N7483_008293 [Penicillium malachiteum]